MVGIYLIGLIAQVFFSARMLIQWILSEKKKKVVSPSLYWVFSLLGAYLLCIYGWLRNDFSIILGQFISFYVYIWNLKEKGLWNKLPRILQAILVMTPVVAAVFALNDFHSFIDSFFMMNRTSNSIKTSLKSESSGPHSKRLWLCYLPDLKGCWEAEQDSRLPWDGCLLDVWFRRPSCTPDLRWR